MVAAVETMMYAKQTPWHGEGVYVGDEDVLSAQAIEASGLDWTVSKRALFSPAANGWDVTQIETHVSLVRDTDEAVLGVVGAKYEPLQNYEAFSIMDSLVQDGDMRYHTAGSLRGGKRIWLLGKIGSHEVVAGDRVDQYMLLWNTHDGSGAVRILPTEVRVVCANTAAVALRNGRRTGLSVRHTKNMKARIQDANNALVKTREAFEDAKDFHQKLADVSFLYQWNDFVHELVPDPAEGVNNTRAKNTREELTGLFHSGVGNNIPGVVRTGWAAYNAVTEYNSFSRTVRGGGSRFEATLFGSGQAFYDRAVTLLHQAV
mgnify:CR=1 FL=1|tara:strand:- start:4460 stop:5410 length:951 start_codon:yes stop_codon:yes gene_type:complete